MIHNSGKLGRDPDRNKNRFDNGISPFQNIAIHESRVRHEPLSIFLSLGDEIALALIELCLAKGVDSGETGTKHRNRRQPLFLLT